MKIFKTKKYSILSNILKFSFIGVLAVVLVFPSLFINNSVKNTEAVNEGIYAKSTTPTTVELKAHGLNQGVSYTVELGKDPGNGTFIPDAYKDISSSDFGSDGVYIFTMNHPTGYAPGLVYLAILSRTNPVFNFNIANGSVTIPASQTPIVPDNTVGNEVPDNTVGVRIDTKIDNPLGDKITDIPSFIKAIVEIVLTVGIPIVALAIIYTGFLFVTAQGNSEKITKAKKALVYTLIGAALLLGAFVIAQAIGATVEDIKSTT